MVVVKSSSGYFLRNALGEVQLKRILDADSKEHSSGDFKILKLYNGVKPESLDIIKKSVEDLKAGKSVNLEKILQ